MPGNSLVRFLRGGTKYPSQKPKKPPIEQACPSSVFYNYRHNLHLFYLVAGQWVIPTFQEAQFWRSVNAWVGIYTLLVYEGGAPRVERMAWLVRGNHIEQLKQLDCRGPHLRQSTYRWG